MYIVSLLLETTQPTLSTNYHTGNWQIKMNLHFLIYFRIICPWLIRLYKYISQSISLVITCIYILDNGTHSLSTTRSFCLWIKLKRVFNNMICIHSATRMLIEHEIVCEIWTYFCTCEHELMHPCLRSLSLLQIAHCF